MFRKRILLATLLKPVNDTRMYGKLGQSLTKLPGAQVHIAGYKAPLPEQTNITFYPLFSFKRFSWQRLAAQWTYWKLLKQLQPNLLLVCTHELLPLSWWYKKKYGGQLVYDVQENYQLNLETQHVYGRFLGKWLGKLVRWLEKRIAPSVDHFFLAEASYAQQLPFLGKRFTILENKYKAQLGNNLPVPATPITLDRTNGLKLLYTGTISHLYGVLEAISFAKQVQQLIPGTTLTIIGYAADPAFLKQVETKIQGLPFVHLIGGDALVPHGQIIALEQSSHIGLMPYHPHPSTFTCIPTKLFEYMANGLVVLAQTNPLWEQRLQEAEAGFCIDFQKPIHAQEIEKLLKRTYYSSGIPKNVTWQQEEEKLITIIHQITQQENNSTK